MNNSRIVVVKLGTSTVTDKTGAPNVQYVQDLARQVKQLRAGGTSVVIVTSGAVGSGCSLLKLKSRPRTIPQKQAAAAVGQGLLMHTYATAFEMHGLSVGQVLLTREDLGDRKRYLNARNTFAALLKYGAVPVVNENDTVAVDEIKIGDNDTLAALVACLVEADVLILLSDVDGLYDKNPHAHDDAKIIPVVPVIDAAVVGAASGSISEVGTGGMSTKIRAAEICVGAGIKMVIANGRTAEVLDKALNSQVGTAFLPSIRKLGSRQQWMIHASTAKGSVYINEGARERIVRGNKSLLPAGVIDVTGSFGAGELVQIVDSSGTAIAKGFVNYSAVDVSLIKGKKSGEIELVLGRKPYDEIVHRDNLALG